MTYFVLDTPGQPGELARVSLRGVAAFYEPVTDSWINDPLLAPEILAADVWRPARVDELPPGIVVDDPAAPEAKPSRRRRTRKRGRPGTHAA
ncbi:hypothetical protein [Aeromicrobium stalagmiti]|uniref:hypothetical protein n=1 Tax=Aeromicrobium stalagmiti TaxID=2738988 RepID=UPI001568C6A4|nr:hypothetical protein [Aeromicrobium stalagmiti]NRQ50947.1 hypothetical protein [Aeromicrobium stalagmiti]